MARMITILAIAALLLAGCSFSAPESLANSVQEKIDSGISQTAAPSVTREEAEIIALKHAGFTADQVTRLRTEYEIDNGIPQYDVQFYRDRWEYEYEINANTGEILSYHRDD